MKTGIYSALKDHRDALALMGLAVFALLIVADPATSSLFPPCLWREATGWLCPGCGSARAVHALAHGHFVDALNHNPLTVAAIPMGGMGLVARWGLVDDVLTYRVRPWHVRILALGVVAFGILRNLVP